MQTKARKIKYKKALDAVKAGKIAVDEPSEVGSEIIRAIERALRKALYVPTQ